MALVRQKAAYVADDAPDKEMAQDCGYGWRVTTFETNTRFEATLATRHATAEQAFLEATDLRQEVLGFGFYEWARCEVLAVRMEAGDNGFVGWRGRVDLGLRPVGDPRGTADD